MRYLLDTGFLIESMKGQRRRKTARSFYDLGVAHSAISIITLAELYEGPYHSTNPQAVMDRIHDLTSHLPVIPLSPSICRRFGEIRAGLRHNGVKIPDLDLFIGATAVEYDLTLITPDLTDFMNIPDLRVTDSRDSAVW